MTATYKDASGVMRACEGGGRVAGICLPDGAWNWINHPRPGPVISSQPHLGDHYICLCMLNILRNYTRQVSKSRLSLYLPLALPFSAGSPFILSPQRDRETITITGHSSLAQDYFPGKKRSTEYRRFLHVGFLCA